MAENRSGSPVVFRRALAVVAALALLTSAAQVALAEPTTKQKLEDAKAEFEQLKGEIESQQRVVSALLLEAQRIAERKEVALRRVAADHGQPPRDAGRPRRGAGPVPGSAGRSR